MITLLLLLVFTHTWALDNVYWEAYGYSTQGTRFSPLSDLNTGNVNKLVVNWRYSIGKDDAGGSRQPTPIVVDDGNGRSVLVFSTQYNSIIALDPTTGALRWRQDIFANRNITRSYLYYSRGVSSWLNPNKKNGEFCRRSIFMSTIDFQLVSVDAKDGVPCNDFGKNGSVFVLEEDSHPVDADVWDLRNPPVVVNGVVAISPQVSDGVRQNITKGPTWAFNATTGDRLWTFYPIPRNKSDPAYDTWPNGTESVGGGNAWPVMSGDNDLKLIFMPVGSASPDLYGGGRPGDNSYTSSLVAVDALTGKVKWYYQIVRHDIWDMDVACQPTVSKYFNRTVVILGTKAAMIWMFDAVTGEPIPTPRNISVPDSFVPGERPSPIQYIPGNDAFILLPQIFNESLIWGPNDQEKQSCLNRYYNLTGRQKGEIFTPISLNGSIISPALLGGINWGGCAANTAKGTFTCVVKNNAFAVKFFPHGTPPDNWCTYFQNQSDTPYYFCSDVLTSPKGFPCVRPPWAELVMLDINSFEVKWRSPLGYVPNDEYRVEWGSIYQTGGVMQTQGGLIFVTGTLDKHLWVFDADKGFRIFYTELSFTAYMTPITYRLNDKQYIVVLSSNGTQGEIIAWSLPPPTYDWGVIFGVTFGCLGFCVLIVIATALLKKHNKGYTSISSH